MKKRKDFRVNLTLSIIIRATSEQKAKGKAWMYGSLLRGAEIDSVEAYEINPPGPNPPIVWQGKCSCPLCLEVIELRRGETAQEKGWVISQTGKPYCPKHKHEALE